MLRPGGRGRVRTRGVVCGPRARVLGDARAALGARVAITVADRAEAAQAAARAGLLGRSAAPAAAVGGHRPGRGPGAGGPPGGRLPIGCRRPVPSSQASSVAIGPRAPPRHSQTHESAGGRFLLVQAPELMNQGEAAACPSGRTAGRWVCPMTMNATSARSATSWRSMPRAASIRHSSTVAGVDGSTGVRVGTPARARRPRRRSMRRATLGRPASERRWIPRRVVTSRPLACASAVRIASR